MVWNKGLTRYNNSSVRRISETMKEKKIDNFAEWRAKMRLAGKIKTEYKDLERNGDTAELIGLALGDGHIGVFPRTEALLIFCNSEDTDLIKRCAYLVEKAFGKKPAIRKVKKENCVRICIYEKEISRRIGIPPGSKAGRRFCIPRWIVENRGFMIRYLRGLYEAEGCFSVHKPTSTYKLFFTNSNESLRQIVYDSMESLGFHLNMSGKNVQISRKNEVYAAIELLKFRKY